MNEVASELRTFEAEKVIQPIYTGGDVAIAANGRTLATSLGEDVSITNLQTGVSLARVEGDGEVLTALLLTPNATHLIACSRSLSMRIYALDEEEASGAIDATLVRTLKPHTTPVVSATVDSTGTLIATGSADGVIKVWDIRGGYVTHTFRGHSGLISALRFFKTASRTTQLQSSKKNKRKSQTQDTLDVDVNRDAPPQEAFHLASGGEDGKIRIWDLEKRKSVASLDSHVSVVRGLDFSAEQGALISGSRDRTVIVWDALSWQPRRVMPILEVIESAGFVWDEQLKGELIYTGGENGRLRLWSIETGREVTGEQDKGGEGEGIISVLHFAGLPLILTVHTDQSLLLYSASDLPYEGAASIMEPLSPTKRISGTHDEIIDMTFLTPDNNLMALATNSESIRLISVPSTNTLEEAMNTDELSYFGADVALLQGHEEIVICLDVDWSGCWLATGAKDNTARLWRIDHANGVYECYTTLTGHAESIGAISLPKMPPPPDSPAFKSPASHPPSFLLTGSQDKTIKRWSITPPSSNDQKPSRAIYTRKAHDKDINALDTNHNGTLFASASQDRLVKIWSVEEGEAQGVLRGHKRGVWSVKFAPKNTPTITGDAGPTKTSRGIILTGSGDKTVRIWSLADYSCLRTLEGHTNSVLKVVWMRPPPAKGDDEDSHSREQAALVASAGGDGLVKVWNVASGECAATLDNHEDRVWALAGNATTGQLVSGGGDGVITFWRDTTQETAAQSAAASTARVEQEQTLLNHVHHGNYREAIVLALQLNHPARLLALLTDVVKMYPNEADSMSGVKAVDDVLKTLADDQLYTLLLRLRDWNTNARTAPVAQRILWVIVKSYPASRLVELRKNGRGLGEVLDGLKAYTDRHYKRMEELLEESYIVDFVVKSMGEGGFVDSIDAAPNGRFDGADVVMVE
jgi:U3 small nucleolar RNA-associated protein 13